MSRSRVLGILLAVGLISLLIPLAIALAHGDVDGTVTIRDSDDTDYSALLSDKAIISLTLPALSSDSVYEGWLITDDGARTMSIGTFGSTGTISTTFTSPDGENLISVFDRFVVSIEPANDPDPAPTTDDSYDGGYPYTDQIPAAAMTHVRHLVSSLDGSTAPAIGLRQQASAALKHAGIAASASTLALIQASACDVINNIEGKDGANADASCGFPDGDEFGLIPYADATASHAALASDGAPTDTTVTSHSTEAVASANQASAWAASARDLAVIAKASTSLTDAQFNMANAEARLEKALNGFDADNDGTIERITGEGGAVQAYSAAQDMSMYKPLEAAAPPAPTATPYPTYTPAPTPTPYPTYTPAPTLEPVVVEVELPDTGDPIIPNIVPFIIVSGAILLLLGGAFIYRRSRQQA